MSAHYGCKGTPSRTRNCFRFSDAECVALAERYLADRTVTQRSLEKELRAGSNTIGDALRRGGVNAQYRQERGHVAHSMVTSNKAAIAGARMCELFDAGATAGAIADELGYTVDGVRKALLRYDRRYGHKTSGYTLAKRQTGPACRCGILLAEEPGVDGVHCRYCCEEVEEGIVPAYVCGGVEDEQVS